MADYPNVHFWGEWTRFDKATVASAIEAYEREAAPTSLPPEVGKPWIAVAHHLPTRGRYFFAKRFRLDHTFTARTSATLAEAIRGHDVDASGESGGPLLDRE